MNRVFYSGIPHNINIMANWCNNSICFQGEAEAIEKLRLILLQMAEREIMEEKGQLPSGFDGGTGYLFEIDWDEERLNYLTKWNPNFAVMIYLAHKYGVNFVYNYDEMAMGIFGEAQFKEGDFYDVCLDGDDFSCYECQKDSENYLFEGSFYNSEWEILDLLLDRRKAKFYG